MILNSNQSRDQYVNVSTKLIFGSRLECGQMCMAIPNFIDVNLNKLGIEIFKFLYMIIADGEQLN